MKLTVALLAIAESNQNVKGEKPSYHKNGPHRINYGPKDGSRSAYESRIKPYHHVPEQECSADLITSTESADGSSGSVLMDGHQANDHCFVNLGPQCKLGSYFELTHRRLETAYGVTAGNSRLLIVQFSLIVVCFIL